MIIQASYPLFFGAKKFHFSVTKGGLCTFMFPQVNFTPNLYIINGNISQTYFLFLPPTTTKAHLPYAECN